MKRLAGAVGLLLVPLLFVEATYVPPTLYYFRNPNHFWIFPSIYVSIIVVAYFVCAAWWWRRPKTIPREAKMFVVLAQLAAVFIVMLGFAGL